MVLRRMAPLIREWISIPVKPPTDPAITMVLRRMALLISEWTQDVSIFHTLLLDGYHPQDVCWFLLEFAHGKVDPHEAGQAGGHAGTTSTVDSGDVSSSGGKYKPVEHGGLKSDGGKDKRVGTHGRFSITFCFNSILTDMHPRICPRKSWSTQGRPWRWLQVVL